MVSLRRAQERIVTASRRALALSLLGVDGCTVGPDSQMPDLSVSVIWIEVEQNSVVLQPIHVTQWWTAFNDRLLVVHAGPGEFLECARIATLALQFSRPTRPE
jgi:hypothetical protein